MKGLMRISMAAVGVLLVAGAVAPSAHAACATPNLITTFNVGAGNYSYVQTYGVAPGGGGYNGSTVTAALSGSFWHVGNGDPTIGLGSDNGNVPALGTPYGIVYPYSYGGSGYAFIDTTWADTRGGAIDGCITSPQPGGPAEQCMCLHLNDVSGNGVPAFALACVPQNLGNFFFDQPGGASLVLNEYPQASITDSVRDGSTGVTITVQAPSAGDLANSLYIDESGDCAGVAATAIQEYAWWYQVLPRGSEPPSSFDPADWTDSGQRTPAAGGSAMIAVSCASGDSDVYVGYTTSMDSGFGNDSASGLVSPSSTRVECGPNFAEVPDRRINSRKSTGDRPAPRTRRGR